MTDEEHGELNKQARRHMASLYTRAICSAALQDVIFSVSDENREAVVKKFNPGSPFSLLVHALLDAAMEDTYVRTEDEVNCRGREDGQ